MNPLKAKYQSLAPRAEVLFDKVINKILPG